MKTPRKNGDAGEDLPFMRLALSLARRGYGHTSPNPMVGAVLVRSGEILGRGWHRRAGEAHAEILALGDAENYGHDPAGATLYVTLEPCSTQGRTPPCTEAILRSGVHRIVIAATDPNPRHAGRAYRILRRAGLEVTHGVLARDAETLNEAFNHWIVHHTPFVTVKTAMTLDGKIATASGESKWITGEKARAWAMKLRQGADAILVGVNTVLLDNPSLTVRSTKLGQRTPKRAAAPLRRIILDSQARTPADARVVSDEFAAHTTIVVTSAAPPRRVERLARTASIWVAPVQRGRIDLTWLVRKLGAEQVTHLLVEGGGEVNSSFLFAGLAQRIAFFYAPKILGGLDARRAVAGTGARKLSEILTLQDAEWRRLGPDLLLTARIA